MSDKTILITGASSGIGASIARRFSTAGYSVIIAYNNNSTGANLVSDQCKGLGAKDVFVVNLDIGDYQSILKAKKEIENKFKSIDVLINNAGVMSHNSLLDSEVKEITKQIRVNFEGTILVTKEFLNIVNDSIVNIGSRLAFLGKRNLSIYCASKFGIRGFTKALAKEQSKLKIFCVNPSLTNTRLGNENGIHPDVVADVVFKATSGEIKVKSGDDVNVWYYNSNFLKRIYLKLKMFFNKD